MNALLRCHRRRVAFSILLTALGFIIPIHIISKGFQNSRTFTFADLLKAPGTLQPHDPDLIQYLQDNVLMDIAQFQKTNLTKVPKPSLGSTEFGQINQSAIIDHFLQGKRSGFFIEAGAWDGQYLSNSLFFEKERGWTGLLIEPNTEAFQSLMMNPARNRSVAANACLSIHKYPEQVAFDSADVFGGILDTDHLPDQNMMNLRSGITKGRSLYRVQCYPLYSLLLAMGNPTVDYFSLDIEGAEIKVLLTIPFDKVNIRTLSIEVEHSKKSVIRKMMTKRGYKLYKALKTDYIYVKDDNSHP
ncbi:hypothetical protein TCAL_07481 [Tigriopus californicus]|uniref:Methyltransferase FkbM domain-containing protein n=1 Tax=Tigriopus californicus TaxID=6832 RepID=A0A553NSL3_TIGCA|nr:protein Star-like [Tigriopus californicus]TRY68426.1 hypothetical protein TCAL_07481 [Tigriopus californicus]|eukprot:TCALIF_07481-PA protein Name:"Similar to S Protein Star (Drosophila melanogaster)" AED:0.06 eAED:0.06 QI:125/0.66/0.5/1/0.66/0.25/4/0/300